MAKGDKDKDFGAWEGTTMLGNQVCIKRFETGFTIKKRGELITERIDYKRKTTYHDMTNIISGYYSSQKSNKRRE